MGWLDHGGLGFNYRLSDLAAALGVAQVEKLDSLLERRAAVAALYERAAGRGSRACETPIAGRGEERRSWFVYVVRLPDGVDRDATIARLAERGIASKAYLPCIHLFPHLRELGLPRGPVPGRRSRRRPLAGAAVLPGAERGAGGPRLPGAGRGPRSSGSDGIIAALHVVASAKIPTRASGASTARSIRLAAGALRHRPVAGPRPRPASGSASSTRPSWRRSSRPGAGAGADGRARLRVRGVRRGHPHGDRAAARRGDRAAGRQAPHRPLAQRPGRHRRRDGRPGPLAAGDRALRRRDGAPARPGRGPPRLADARLHPPAARPAGLPRPPPARLLLDARPRRPALPVRARQRQRDAARLRRPGRRQLGDRPRRGRRRPRLRARQPQLDRRRLQPRLRPRLPGRGLGLRDAPLAAAARKSSSGRAPSSASASSTSPSPRAPRSCRRRRTPTRPSCCGRRARGSPPATRPCSG